MKSHFPNKRFCKWSASRHKEELGKTLEEETKMSVKKHVEDLSKHYSKLIKPTRLRGGANVDGVQSSLFVKAISNAKNHGINLVPGVLNKADGNCAFDAVLNNINHRRCFSNKLPLSSLEYRQIWVTELESLSSTYPDLGAGYSQEEKEENWNRLKQFGIYDIDFFGDLVINAIARGCHKNILIFNTRVNAAYPIYVIRAEEFGGFIDTDIPVVVGYNQVHYESLHPVTQEDIENTQNLLESCITGNYLY